MNVLDEYLVKLGASVDASGFARFHNALHEAKMAVEANVQSIAKGLLKVETELVGGFMTMGGAALGLADKVAMADQEYRLFGLHMYMAKDQARGLKIAMDALGQPMENLMWDPELRGRAHQLIQDQREMAPTGDYNEQMRKIRDIRFEFTRMEVEVQYLGMHVVQDFMKALGMGPDDLLKKLRELNAWFIKNMPAISKTLVRDFLPVWKDIVRIGKDVGHVFMDVATIFDNVIGLLSGDDSLKGVATLDKFAASVAKVADWLAVVADWLVKITGLLTGTIVGGSIGGAIGSIVGGIAGIPGGPAGIFAGAAAGGATGTMIGGGVGAATGGAFALYRHFALDKDLTTPSGQLTPKLWAALTGTESGALGMSAVSPKGALGISQLMPATAKALGVNPLDAADNVRGGQMYLNQMLAHYHGNVALALGGYNAGPSRMDQFLAGKATLPEETKNYIATALGKAGKTGDVTVGTVTIHITQPNASPHQIQRAVVAGLRESSNKQTQRTLAEFDGLSYSYGG